jgi:hypothetical protein
MEKTTPAMVAEYLITKDANDLTYWKEMVERSNETIRDIREDRRRLDIRSKAKIATLEAERAKLQIVMFYI